MRGGPLEAALAAPLCRMAEVMGRMEERERSHGATVLAMEKDMALRQQALETFKKKVRGVLCVIRRADDEGLV